MKKFFTIITLLILVAQVHAFTPLPYCCGFEKQDSTELNNWVLNYERTGRYTESTLDRWCIGDAIHYQGEQSLYISGDAGVTNSNVVSSLCTGWYQLAYRDFVLPTGQYRLNFKYINPFLQETIGDEGLSMGILLYRSDSLDALTYFNFSPNYQFNRNYKTSKLPYTDYWQNKDTVFSVEQNSNSTIVIRIYFAWRIPNQTLSRGPVLDNIEIAQAGCDEPSIPTHLYCTDATGQSQSKLCWHGSADVYHLELYSDVIDSCFSVTTTDTFMLCDNLPDGIYLVSLKAECRSDSTSYYSNYVVTSLRLGHMDADSFDYLNICDTARAVLSAFNRIGDNYSSTNPILDDMSNSASTHSICTNIYECDPITGLSIMPKGTSGVVRLGQSDLQSSYCCKIEYPFYVKDSTLLIKYFPVVVYSGHVDSDEGYISFRLLDESREEIQTYHMIGTDLKTSSSDFGLDQYYYSYWDTCKFDLSAQIGRVNYLEITSSCCYAGLHGAYMYYSVEYEKKIHSTIENVTSDSVIISWLPVDSAASYVLEIHEYVDSAYVLLDSVMIRADGIEGLPIFSSSSPSRMPMDNIGSVVIITINPASGTTATSPISVSVSTTDTRREDYLYIIKAFGVDQQYICSGMGLFTLNEDAPIFEALDFPTYGPRPQKILRGNQILIYRDGVVYSLQGQVL